MIDPSQLQQSPEMIGAMAPAAGPSGPPPPGAPAPVEMMPPGPQGPVVNAPNEQPKKKPPLMIPSGLAKEIAQEYVNSVRAMAGSVADYAGPPSEYEKMKRADQVRAWNKRDVRQDPLALREQGLTATQIRDKVYPLRRILLKLAGPRPEDRAKFARQMKDESAKLEYDSSTG